MVAFEKNKPSISTLFFTSAGHFMNDGFMFLFPVITDILSKIRDYPPSYLTVLFVAFYSASTFFGLYASRMADKGSILGRIHTGIFLISIGMAGLAYSILFSGDYALTVLSSILAGMGSGFYHPIGAAILQRSYPDRMLGKALGINGSMGSIGRAIFPLIFLGLAEIVGHGFSLIIFALAGLVVSAAIGLGLRVENIGTRKASRGMVDVINYSIVLLTILFFIRSVSAQGMIAWIPTFLTHNKNAGIGVTLGVVLTIMYVAPILSQPLFGILVDRLDKRFLLFLSSAGTAISMYAYISSTGTLELIFLSIFGFFTFSGFPLTMSLVSDYAPKGPSSLTNSIVWGLGSSGGMIAGPLIAGAIILNNYSRITLSFEVMIVLSFIVAILSLFLPKVKKKSKMPLFG